MYYCVCGEYVEWHNSKWVYYAWCSYHVVFVGCFYVCFFVVWYVVVCWSGVVVLALVVVSCMHYYYIGKLCWCIWCVCMKYVYQVYPVLMHVVISLVVVMPDNHNLCMCCPVYIMYGVMKYGLWCTICWIYDMVWSVMFNWYW